MSNSPWTAPWTRKLRFLRTQPILQLALLLLALASFPGIQANAQSTNFEIGTTVLHSPVKHLGINIAGQTFYDSGQMLRNLIFQNPGFEGEQWQSILNCVAATATTCTDADNYNYWPANFMQGATFEFIYGTANGQTGTVSASTAGSQGGSSGITLTFSAPLSPAPSAGDYVIVRQKFPGNAQGGWWTSTSGGGTLSTDTTDIAPDSPGVQALSMNASASGQTASVNQAFDSTSGRSFVQLNGSYTLTFKAKGMGGSNQMNVDVMRLTSTHGVETFLDQNVNLTDQWQDYSYTFNASEDGTYIGTGQAIFTVSGANAYLDDVALTEAAAANNPTPFRNAVVTRLQQLQPGVIRYMDSGTDFGSTIDNMLAVPFARQGAGYAEFETSAPEVPMGLHEFLQLCQAVGAEPWYTMPAGMTTTEMQNLIQYLGGASSTPYGAIRANLGQATPWTSVFPVIHLEFGNEMWNGGAFSGEDMLNPVAYGNRAATIFAAARASASYNPSSFDLVIDSQAVNPWLTGQVLSNSSGYDTVDAAPYIFDSLNDYSSNEAIYGSMFAEPEAVDSVSSGYMAQQAQAAATGGSTPANLAIYEVNLGTGTGTAPQNTLTSVVGSVGAGIAVADHMLLMLRDDDITTQNLFALPEYTNSYTNTATGASGSTPLWGSVIDMGGETNLNRPTFLAEELANSAIFPTELAITTTGSNPTWNQPLSTNNDIQLANAHYLQSFAFTNGTQSGVVVFNLSRSGSLPVTFSGANAPTGDVLISQLTSVNPTDNNENLTTSAAVVSNTQTNVSNFNPATPYSLPPFSMTVFTWPGTTLPATTTSLTASPTSGATGQSITLTATVASKTGSNTPTGTVNFLNGATTIGSAAVNASGVASLSTTALPAGADSITASYGGDANDAGSSSSPVTVTITSNALATTTSLTASPTQINTGQTVTFTATVAPQSGTAVPTGVVTFLSGSNTLGSATLNASGSATFSTAVLTAGADSITASYGGSSSDASSVSSAVTVNVTQTVVATTTTLIASAVQVTPGQNVVLTATVAPASGSTTPTGTVTFLNGATTLGTGTLSASGAASLSTTTLPAGANSITASYGGSAGNSSSVSAAVVVNVAASAVATTTTLTSTATQINTGQSVTFTAKVAPQSGSTIPTGTVAFLNGTTILGTAALNAAGTATFSTTALPAGSDPITASYGGSTTDASSVSTAVTVNVTQTLVATTTSLTASATQINTGQSVTFTAIVAPASGTTTPTGTVTFMEGATPLGTATLNGSGAASLSTSALSAGTQSITASYAGSTTNSSSVSAAVAVTVTQTLVATTTALSASATAINSGQSVTFTAKVSPQSGTTTPTGVVTFSNGATILGTGTLNAGGTATLSTTSLPAGTDSITAAYGGSASDSSSVSAPVTIAVTQSVVATTTALSASATQSLAGQNITFTARVTPQSGTIPPSGTVTFMDGAVTLGTATLNGGGAGSLSTSALTAGTHTITASYGGSSSDSASVSAAVIVTVGSAPVQTNTVLTASSTAINTGQSVTFTATVTPQTGSTPVNQLPVAFLNGSTIIGTATTNASGVATFTTTSLRAGADSITASYTGNNTDLSSVSNAIVVNVTQTLVATTTLLNASATQLTTGQSVTLTATVSPASGTATPRGTVTFLDGTTSLGTGTLNSSGVAFLAVATLSAGNHSITASYGGSTFNSTSVSSPITITVAQGEAATSTSLTSSANAINTGQSVTFTAKVAPQSGSTVPTGMVAFLDGSGIIGIEPLNGSGVATLTTTSLPAGTQSITASYQGSSSDDSSVSAAVAIVVTQSVIATTTALTASATQIDSGGNLVLTATVAAQTGSAIPAGTVTFLDGATVLGTGTLNASGTAFFAITTLAVGNHSIIASYGGNAADSKSVSAAITVTVAQSVVATTTSLTSSTTQTMLGQNIVFTAMVAAHSGATPTGTVYLLDGGAIVSAAQLNASGAAAFNVSSLSIGSHSITASYGGSSSDDSSSSSPIAVQVSPDDNEGTGTGPTQTLTSLTSSVPQAPAGQNVTFTATVIAQSGSAIPTGYVTFYDGSSILGSAVLAGGAASFSTTNLQQGTDLITAVYGGNSLELSSVSSVLAIVVTAPAPPVTAGAAIATTTTLTASATQVTAGQAVSFSANVMPQSGSGVPTGTVTYLDGQTTLGTGNLNGASVAAFSTTQLAAGTHSITASYGGDANNSPSASAAITVTVAPSGSSGTPGYSMTVSNSDVSVTRGQVANLTVTLTPVNGFNMPVSLSCSGLPAGTTCSFSPPTVTPNGAPASSTLSILVASSTTAAENRAPGGRSGGRLAFGLVMPWGLISLLGLSKRKNRSRLAGWPLRLVVTAALIAGSLWMSGCGYTVNGSAFTMTLTAGGQNVPTQTSQITVNIAP